MRRRDHVAADGECERDRRRANRAALVAASQPDVPRARNAAAIGKAATMSAPIARTTDPGREAVPSPSPSRLVATPNDVGRPRNPEASIVNDVPGTSAIVPFHALRSSAYVAGSACGSISVKLDRSSRAA